MTDTDSARWQPLSALPQVARAIGEQFHNTRELYEHLCSGRDQPHLLDDALVERVLRHVRDQLEFLPVYREQLSRWYPLQPTAAEFIELDRVTHHLDRWEELLKQQRALAEELPRLLMPATMRTAILKSSRLSCDFLRRQYRRRIRREAPSRSAEEEQTS